MKRYRISRINQEIDGISYIRSYVHGFTKVGGLYKACCPFHNEKTPSFTIYPVGYINRDKAQDHVSYYCFGCSAGGDIINFCAKINNVTRDEAVKILEQYLGIEEHEDESAEELEFVKKELKQYHNSPVTHISFEETNLYLSLACRKYLEYVKHNNPDKYKREEKRIDRYYVLTDKYIMDFNEVEAYDWYQKIYNKLTKLYKQR